MAEIKRLIPGETPVVVDGGANQGEFIHLIQQQYDAPTIYAFEPIPDLATQLAKAYQSNGKITVYSVALGPQEAAVDLNIANIVPASSILRSSEIGRKHYGGGLEPQQVVTVPQKRLDQLVEGEIDILKLDLQGYEIEALKGASRLFKNIKLILIETEFVQIYQDQPLFSDIDHFLRGIGFHFFNFFDLSTHTNGQLYACDAIFLNGLYFSEGAPTRCKESLED